MDLCQIRAPPSQRVLVQPVNNANNRSMHNQLRNKKKKRARQKLTGANDNKYEEPQKNGTNWVVVTLLDSCLGNSAPPCDVLLELLVLPISKAS